MRLIDADALIDNIPQADLNNDKKISKCGAIADMVLLVCDAPTISAVPVVRCGECGHYDTTGYPALNPGTGWCDKMDRGVHDNFYCSYGERKESEGST